MLNRPLSRAELTKGSIQRALSALFYGVATVLARYAFAAGVTPETAICLRFVIAACVLGGVLAANGQLSKLTRTHTLVFFLLGLFAYTVMGTTWFIALNSMPSWLVSLFIASYPLTVTLSAWLFLGDTMDAYRWASLFTVILGSVLIILRPFEGASLVPVLLMLGNIVTYTIYMLVGQKWSRGVSPLLSTFWISCGAALGTFLYALAVGRFALAFHPSAWLWLALLGVVSTVLSIVLLWQSVNLIGATRSALVGAISPLVSIVLGVTLLGERMTAIQAVGGALILAGVLIVQLRPMELSARPKAQEASVAPQRPTRG